MSLFYFLTCRFSVNLKSYNNEIYKQLTEYYLTIIVGMQVYAEAYP